MPAPDDGDKGVSAAVTEEPDNGSRGAEGAGLGLL